MSGVGRPVLSEGVRAAHRLVVVTMVCPDAGLIRRESVPEMAVEWVILGHKMAAAFRSPVQ